MHGEYAYYIYVVYMRADFIFQSSSYQRLNYYH